MEYDEGREITRLIAEEMLNVGRSFPNISSEKINLLAALHLTKGLILEDRYRSSFEDARVHVTELMKLNEFDDTDVRAAFNEKLLHIRAVSSDTMDREVRVKTATHLIDLFIFEFYKIVVVN